MLIPQTWVNRNFNQRIPRIHRNAVQFERMRLANTNKKMRNHNLPGFQIASQYQIRAQTRVNCFGLPEHQTDRVVLNSVNCEGILAEVKRHIGDADDGEDFGDKRIILGDVYCGKNAIIERVAC